MGSPSAGIQTASDVLSRKTCRRCMGALFADSDCETFPVADIGTMHKSCALEYCREHSLTLEQATPVCKHWRTRGYCIYEDRCFYQHPPDARASPKPEPQKPTQADLAARAAAWRALNAATQKQLQAAKMPPLHAASEATCLQSHGPRSSAADADAGGNNLAFDQRQQQQEQPSPSIAAWGNGCLQQDAGSDCSSDLQNGVSAQLDAQPPHFEACSLTAAPALNGDAEPQQPHPAEAEAPPVQNLKQRPGLREAVTMQEDSAVLGDPVLAAASDPFLAAALPTPRRCNAAAAIQNRGVGRRNKVRNRFRASVFRRFLLDTFGRERLSSGTGVLDIAGGKGDLAFELVNLNRIPATVVDPRPLKLDKRLIWLRAGFYHRNVIFSPYVDVPLQQLLEQEPQHPQALRMVATEDMSASIAAADVSMQQSHVSMRQSPGDDSALVRTKRDHVVCSVGLRNGISAGIAAAADVSVRRKCGDVSADVSAVQQGPADGVVSNSNSSSSNGLSCNGSSKSSDEKAGEGTDVHALLARAFQHALEIRWTHRGLEHEGATSAQDSDDESKSCPDEAADVSSSHVTPDTPNLDSVIDLWQRCSILVGMHPDQATETIVDFAQRTRKPFAVVPCCVYSAEFPRRRLPSGHPVKAYDDLIAYIIAKDPAAVRVKELPFEGRNKVVYVTHWSDKA